MFRFALANLLSRPGRTVLSTLGLTIAVAGMVGLFAIAGGIDDMLEEGLGGIPGVVVLQPGAPIPLFSTLPAKWGDEMTDISGIHVVNPEVWARVNLLDGENVFSPPRLLLGIDIPSRLRLQHGVYADQIENGRFLTEQDRGESNIVISRQIAEDLGKQVNETVDLNSRQMTIVGIYHTGSLLADVTIIADIDVVREMSRVDPSTVNCFYVEQEDGVTTDEMIDRIQDHFAGREPSTWEPSRLNRALASPPTSLGEWIKEIADILNSQSASSENDWESTQQQSHANNSESSSQNRHVLEVHSVADWGDRFTDLWADLDLVLGLLTGLGIMIAVFSILNTMLMSVMERTIEFGILRANGWSQSDIVRLITCESALIGLAGGILGVLLGWVGTQVINSVWSNRAHLYAGPMLLTFSLVFSIIIGMLGGLYPGIRAARMSPMQAIRRG